MNYQFYPFNYKNVVKADDTCVVIRGESAMAGYSGHCGYCIFPKNELPAEWHGEYNADGLNLLNVHGGITYCEVEGGDMEARDAALKVLYAAKDAEYAAQKESGDEFVSKWSEYHDRGKKIRLEHGYTHVVFGFDCAHYGDDSNYSLFDADHVFKLAHQMRAQIAECAKRIGEYRVAGSDRQIEIMDEIRAAASIKNEVPVFSIISLAART